MKIVLKVGFYTLVTLMLIGCAMKTQDECCPGYESVAQPDKCVKMKKDQTCMKETVVTSEKMTPIEELADGKPTLGKEEPMLISVLGQGVAPMNTSSPAQAYALAKRAAVADAYRLIAEKVKGVKVDGQDTIENMMVKRSTVRTSVNAMIRNANVVETTFKEGLCEVEMEITITHSQFAQ